MTTTPIATPVVASAAGTANGRGRSVWRTLAAATIATSVVAAAAFGVWASLTATANNVTPQAASTGTLKLELGANGAGFTQSVTNLAPGDAVNRYVTLTNAGTLAAGGMSMAVAATGDSALLNDAGTSKALRLTVDSCSVAWNATTGACGGTVTNQLNAVAVSSPATALAGITSSAPGAVHHLRVNLQLPDQSENVINGVLPAGTIQDAAAQLTYTFSHSQRSPATTSS